MEYVTESNVLAFKLEYVTESNVLEFKSKYVTDGNVLELLSYNPLAALPSPSNLNKPYFIFFPFFHSLAKRAGSRR